MSETMEDDGLRANREIDWRIGEVLRSQRLACRLSMDEVGRAIGVTYQQVQKYERGVNRIPASTLYRLATFLQCDLAVFYERIGGARIDLTLRPNREDVKVAQALDRIEDPFVRSAL